MGDWVKGSALGLRWTLGVDALVGLVWVQFRRLRSEDVFPAGHCQAEPWPSCAVGRSGITGCLPYSFYEYVEPFLCPQRASHMSFSATCLFIFLSLGILPKAQRKCQAASGPRRDVRTFGRLTGEVAGLPPRCVLESWLTTPRVHPTQTGSSRPELEAHCPWQRGPGTPPGHTSFQSESHFLT